MELPMNIIVLLIISIVIFGLAIGMTIKFLGKSQEVSEQLDKDTENQLFAMLVQPNTLVALPIKTASLNRGGTAKFGLGVRNVGPARQFRVIAAFDQAFDLQGRELQGLSQAYINDNWLGRFRARWLQVGADDRETLSILVKVAPKTDEASTTKPGEYTFNVCVISEDEYPGSDEVCSVDNFRNDKTLFYGSRIERLTISVR
jgi:hypothetical protein